MISRRILMFCGLLLVTTLVVMGADAPPAAPAAPAANAMSGSYSNSQLGFAMGVPNFGQPPAGAGMMPVVFAGPGIEGFSSNINILLQEGASTPDEYLATSMKEFLQAGMKLIKEERRKVSGKDALVLEFEGNQQGRQLKFLSMAVFADTRVYLVTCTATPEQFPKDLAEFNKTIDSFRLTGK